MKHLYISIMESRGWVNNENSWSKLVDKIIDNEDYKDVLPPWIYDVHLQENKYSGIAAYDDKKSTIIDGLLDVYINVVYGKLTKTVLEHEFQHAYDDWILKTKTSKPLMGPKYCISVGAEDGSGNVGVILFDKPTDVSSQDLYEYFSNCTYYFDKIEVNSYSREFILYLMENGTKTYDFNDFLTNMKLSNEIGSGPLVWVYAGYKILDEMDEYNVDWDEVTYNLNSRWCKMYLGKKFPGNDLDTAKTILKYMLKTCTKYTVRKYKRMIQDCENIGITFKNIPNWLK